MLNIPSRLTSSMTGRDRPVKE